MSQRTLRDPFLRKDVQLKPEELADTCPDTICIASTWRVKQTLFDSTCYSQRMTENKELHKNKQFQL